MTILLFLPVCLTGSSAMDFPSLITADGVASQQSDADASNPFCLLYDYLHMILSSVTIVYW